MDFAAILKAEVNRKRKQVESRNLLIVSNAGYIPVGYFTRTIAQLFLVCQWSCNAKLFWYIYLQYKTIALVIKIG